MTKHAAANGVPEALVLRVIKIESGGNPTVVSKGNYGLMQIRLGTAQAMGYGGTTDGLLDADTNMTYAVRYLAGAYRAADGNHDQAIRLYQRGYYYEAKAKGFSPYARRSAPALASVEPARPAQARRSETQLAAKPETQVSPPAPRRVERVKPQPRKSETRVAARSRTNATAVFQMQQPEQQQVAPAVIVAQTVSRPASQAVAEPQPRVEPERIQRPAVQTAALQPAVKPETQVPLPPVRQPIAEAERKHVRQATPKPEPRPAPQPAAQPAQNRTQVAPAAPAPQRSLFDGLQAEIAMARGVQPSRKAEPRPAAQSEVRTAVKPETRPAAQPTRAAAQSSASSFSLVAFVKKLVEPDKKRKPQPQPPS